MVEAVEPGQPGAAAGMDIGKPFEPVADPLQEYIAKGGRISAPPTVSPVRGGKAEHERLIHPYAR